MATSPYGGYTPPSYGGYNGGYNAGYAPNMYGSPVAQQLTRMEQQYPQYGQTVPPMQNMPQNFQQGQGMQPQNQPQQMDVDMSPMAFAVMSEQEARNHPSFMVNGRRHLYYNEGEPDKVYMRYFDMANNGQDVFRVGTFSTGSEQPTTPTETPEKEGESQKANYLTHDDLKPLQDKIEGIQTAHEKILAAIEGLEEKLNAKPGSDSKATGADNAQRSSHDSTGGADDADGSKPGRNGKKPVAADSSPAK